MPADGTIDEELAAYFAAHLEAAVNIGWNATDPKLRSYLSANLVRFSGFRTYAVQQQMREKLTDNEGNLRSFADFRTDALAVNQLYNVDYLRTEYDTAIASAQMASKWSDFPAGSLLRYDTAGDDHVRTEHAAYDGITRPKEDPFWDSHLPPCDWACRCQAIEVDDDTPITPDSKLHGLPEVPDEFRQNVGKTGEVFGPEHPYFQVPQVVAKKLNARAKDKGAVATPATPPRFDAEALAKLRALGITVKGATTDAGLIENAQALAGADLPQLAEDLQAAAKKYRFKWNEPRWLIKNGQNDGTVLYLDYMADTRNETLLMQRRLYIEKGKLYADHDLLDLPEGLQDGGFSQAVNKATYKQYQAMGVQAIRVHASLQAGGYVWAKVGFEATRMVELKEILKDARAAAKVPAPVLDYFQRQLADHIATTPKQPFPIWKWASTEHGKTLLLGTSWHGQLNLKNEQQTAIFEAYLNRPPKPKKPKK